MSSRKDGFILHLWKFTNRLAFDGLPKIWSLLSREKQEAKLSKYCETVNRILESHQNSTIDEFRVCYRWDSTHKSSIDKWIDFAIAKSVQSF